MENSKIGWTTHTFNPWWGCARISPGCKLCYAAALDRRTGGDHWGDRPRKFFGEKHWDVIDKWNRKAREECRRLEAEGRGAEFVPPRVFCASMADVFEDNPEVVTLREKLWWRIVGSPYLDWLLLTKRPENIEPHLRAIDSHATGNAWDALRRGVVRNVWLGATVEGRNYLERAEIVSRLPGAVRFLSMEPLLERVVPGLRRCEHCRRLTRDGLACEHCHRSGWPLKGGIDWVIVGGESGPGARPFNLEWARGVVAECQLAGVPVFVKQLGAHPIEPTIPGRDTGLRLRLADRNGADPAEWPADLQIQQFPQPRKEAA